ncbi:methyltransferase [Streptomyces albus]|uniref:methyltransferase n=1 Tax=Streptomyces albus TaxID=1888 RepID=UPI00379277F2
MRHHDTEPATHRDLRDPATHPELREPAADPVSAQAAELRAAAEPRTAAEPLSETELAARLRAAGCVFAEDEARLLRLTARGPAELERMTGRRAAGEPLEHVLGWAGFDGLRIAVDPGVFVPRRRTEFLVRAALEAVPDTAAPVVLDLCCGTGAVGAAVVTRLGGDARLHAADLDPAAVRCARRNLHPLGGRVYEGDLFAALPAARRNLHPLGGRVYEGDLFAALPAALRGTVHLLTANVPYVPTDDIPLLPSEARDHEPRTALDGGPDGLALLRRVAAEAYDWLAPGGTLLTETGSHQSGAAAGVLREAGLTVRVVSDPELPATVVTATRR